MSESVNNNVFINTNATANVNSAANNMHDKDISLWTKRTKDTYFGRALGAMEDAPVWDNGKIKSNLLKNIKQEDLPPFIKLEELKDGMTMKDLIKKYRPYWKTLYEAPVMKDLNGKLFEENNDMPDPNDMTKEEIDSELAKYSIDSKNMTDGIRKGQLIYARKRRNREDADSEKLDLKAGTFSQGKNGSCAILSAIHTLSEDYIKKFMTVTNDKDGKPNGYKIVFPGDKEKKEIQVSLQELKDDEIKIGDTTYDSFTKGDYTVRAIEMAFYKRYGENIPLMESDKDENGTIKKQRFYFGDNKQIEVSQEEMEKGEFTLNGKKIKCKETATIPRAFEIAHSKNSGKVPDFLANLYKDKENKGYTLGITLAQGTNLFKTEENKVQEINNPTEDDLIKKLVPGSTLGINENVCNKDIVLPNGTVIITEHGYSIEKYDKNKKTLIIKDPYNTSTRIQVPLEIVSKYLTISGK